MFRAHKLSAIAGGLLVALLLAGCSTGSEPSASTPVAPATESSDTQVWPDGRDVIGIGVIDPVTVVVTPRREDDDLFGEELTVHLNDIVAPVKGECGYDQALELATKLVVDGIWYLDYSSVDDGIYVDDKGEHHGWLNSRAATYGRQMVRAGMATAPAGDELSYLVRDQADTSSAGTGLWATCPDFGA